MGIGSQTDLKNLLALCRADLRGCQKNQDTVLASDDGWFAPDGVCFKPWAGGTGL